jgi:hypothetical protein
MSLSVSETSQSAPHDERARSRPLGRRILGLLTLFLAAAGLLLSLAGAVGVWVIKKPVTDRATSLFGRVEAALDLADKGLGEVNLSLSRAAERLDSAREEQKKLAQQPQPDSALRRVLVRTVQQSIAPEFGAANEKLHTVAEAAVVVNSILEDVANFPFLDRLAGLDIERLTNMNSRLADVGPAAWELSRLLGEPDSEAVNTQFSRIDGSLNTMQGFISEYGLRVTEVRQRTEDLKSETFSWITPAAILISVVCAWIALSQVGLLSHAWSWWNSPPCASNARPGGDG